MTTDGMDKTWFAPGPRVAPTMANPTPVDPELERLLAEEAEIEATYMARGRCPNEGCGELLQHCRCEQVEALRKFLAETPSLGERRVVDPVSGGMKGQKNQQASLLPWDALMKVSEHYAAGAEKYSRDNWQRGYAWHLTFDALQRHLAAWWQGEDLDDEGLEHLNAVVFHALALRTFTLRGIGTDDRPK